MTIISLRALKACNESGGRSPRLSKSPPGKDVERVGRAALRLARGLAVEQQPEQGVAPHQAQVQAESGKVFIEMEEWDNAEKALQEAVNFDTGNGDYLAHLAWTVYRNPKNAASRAMQEKVSARVPSMSSSTVSRSTIASSTDSKPW